MALPESLRKRAEEIDAYYAQLNENTAEPAPVETDQTLQSTETPTEQPKESPTASDELNHPTADDAKFEQRYKILQGKYNAEIPVLNARIKDLEGKLAQTSPDSPVVLHLQNQVAQLQAQLNAAQAAAPPTSNPTSNGNATLDKLRDDYGNDLIDGIMTMVRGEVGQVVKPLQTQVENVSSMSKQDQLAKELQPHGLDFNQLNNDPLFIDWLQEIDYASGVNRSQLMNEAYRKGDLKRAAWFFTEYAKSPPMVPVSGFPAVDLHQHVSQPSTATPSNEDVVVRQWDNPTTIKELYDLKARGKIDPEEFVRLEKQLYASLTQRS